MNRVYLDYAATTPVDPRVKAAMEPYFTEKFGNPGSLHSFGQEASAAVFKARQTIAKALNCHYSEIIFTGSATEANNFAIRGAIQMSNIWRIVVTAIEHESVLNTAKEMKRMGVEVVLVPVSKQGIVDLKKLKAALSKPTAVVSVMLANNEVGTIQPIREVSKIVSDFRKSSAISSKLSALSYPLFHTDAAQAFQYIPCDVRQLGVDLLTISSQKIYGPKGIGALYVRSRTKGVDRLYPINSVITGGGQEQGLRSGTENVPAIVGFAKAVELTEAMRQKESARVAELRARAWREIKKVFPNVVINGPAITYNLSPITSRLPNNLNIYIPRVSGEELVVYLDLQGIAVSSGSACAARSIDPSHVLLAMGHDKTRAKNSLRISLGRSTTQQDIARLVAALTKFKKLKTY